MGEVAEATRQAGGRVVGVIPQALVDKELAEPVTWLQQACPALAGAVMALVRPSLEDVFVSCTGQEPRA